MTWCQLIFHPSNMDQKWDKVWNTNTVCTVYWLTSCEIMETWTTAHGPITASATFCPLAFCPSAFSPPQAAILPPVDCNWVYHCNYNYSSFSLIIRLLSSLIAEFSSWNDESRVSVIRATRGVAWTILQPTNYATCCCHFRALHYPSFTHSWVIF